MAFVFNVVDRLVSPLRQIDEQMLDLPEHRQLRFASTVRKMVFMLEGDCYVTFDDCEPWRLRTNDILLVDRKGMQAYTAIDQSKPCQLHVLRLVFDPKVLAPLSPQSRPRRVSVDTTTSSTGFLLHYLSGTELLAGAITPEIREYLAKIRREAEDRGPGYRVVISAVCTALLTLLGRQRVHDTPPSPGEPSNRRPAYVIALSKAYITANLSQRIRLQDVARHVSWSEEHFCRVFRTVTGLSPAQYVRQARLEQAKNHLLGTKASISQIAGMTGFSSLAVFSRCFRRYAGRTPHAYREQERFGEVVEATSAHYRTLK